jgi:murein DD-endopeptidase MepM/ murein hydrolase activator NlpD
VPPGIAQSTPVAALLVALAACGAPAEPAATLRYPVDDPVELQGFGAWNPNWLGYHLAVDVLAAAGTPIYAIADGVVRAVFLHDEAVGYGGLVLIEHQLGSEPVTGLYGHVSSRNPPPIQVGDRVSAGATIAFAADDDEDGGAWAPHLHFGLRPGRVDLGAQYCGRWLYGGYTRPCAGVTHDDVLAQWRDPLALLGGLGTTPGETPRESVRAR